ncbi:MAG: cytochrome P450 [Rhodobacteraceae bacterium]|nr:cytochrome P450 [Paracoccaceae bacterium]
MKSLDQSPLDPEFVQNPYPFYDKARALGPLFYWNDYNIICAAGFSTVNDLLRDRRFGREMPAGMAPEIPAHLKPFYAVESHSLLELEPPTHTRIRGLLVRSFTTRRINDLGPDIDALCRQLCADMPDEPFDLIAKYAEIIPVIIICRLLGVPEEMSDQLLRWSHDMVSMYQARRDRAVEDRAVAATVAFSDYLRQHIDERRKAPKDDLITQLIQARDDGDKLSEDELVTTCILLLNAGHEATVHTITNGVKTLLESGQNLADFFSDDKTTLRTVDETIRFDPPLHMFTRIAQQDVTAFGHDFKAGESVGLLLAAANRDPEKYANPAEFDITRGGVGQLGFGAGLHFCIGAPLARLEMGLALPILFECFPNLKIVEPPVYANRYHFHGLERLMVSK